MAVSVANLDYPVTKLVLATVAFDNSYPTGGESISAASFGLTRFRRIDVVHPSGYIVQPIIAANEATALLKVYRSAGFTPSVANESAHTHAVALDTGVSAATSGGTPSGTNSAPSFTGTAPLTNLDLATPAFSGTGLTAAGQVITTTDNQTMTLNQCAGMWLISATGATPPNLILSNTAVTGAPAVLTVQGAAATDAGAYKIVKHAAPVGTVGVPVFTGDALATHTHGPGTLADAASGAGSAHTHAGSAVAEDVLNEVDNATDLSALSAVVLTIDGY